MWLSSVLLFSSHVSHAINYAAYEKKISKVKYLKPVVAHEVYSFFNLADHVWAAAIG